MGSWVAAPAVWNAAMARGKQWAEVHPRVVRLWLIPPVLVVGVVLVETGRVDGIEPGLRGRGAVPALLHYGFVGWVGSFSQVPSPKRRRLAATIATLMRQLRYMPSMTRA